MKLRCRKLHIGKTMLLGHNTTLRMSSNFNENRNKLSDRRAVEIWHCIHLYEICISLTSTQLDKNSPCVAKIQPQHENLTKTQKKTKTKTKEWWRPSGQTLTDGIDWFAGEKVEAFSLFSSPSVAKLYFWYSLFSEKEYVTFPYFLSMLGFCRTESNQRHCLDHH